MARANDELECLVVLGQTWSDGVGVGEDKKLKRREGE